MRLNLIRYTSDKDSTGGLLYYEGLFLGYTVEDQHQAVKVAKETRIPAGEYKIKLRNEGGMTKRYAKRFGDDIHKGMLWLQDVPGFEWVYIHIGNTDDHTEGCILVGYGALRAGGETTISRSADCYLKLYRSVSKAILAGEEVTIRISNIAPIN
jgi:hypothetical protein